MGTWRRGVNDMENFVMIPGISHDTFTFNHVGVFDFDLICVTSMTF